MADSIAEKLDAAYGRMEAAAIEGMIAEGLTGKALDDAIDAMRRYNRTAREVFETQLRRGALPS